MTIQLEQLDVTTQQPQERIDITELINELDDQGGINLVGCFPAGIWTSGDQTTNSIWDLDSLITIFTRSQETLLQKYPKTPGFSEKPVADLTDADNAFLQTQIHTSVTSESGTHIVRLENPLPPQPSAAAPLIARIDELVRFLQTARNTRCPIGVTNTELTVPAGDTSIEEEESTIETELLTPTEPEAALASIEE